MNKIIAILFLVIISLNQHANATNKRLTRYTTLENVETKSQANLLLVNVNIVFSKNINTVATAIEYMLLRSGYTLQNNSEFERINNLKLPDVHRQIGPIPLIRAIKTLLGKTATLEIDEIHRTISIVKNNQINEHKKTTKNVQNKQNIERKTVDALNKIELVNIQNKDLNFALKNILPSGWKVIFENKYTDMQTQTIDIISEDKSKKQIIQAILRKIKLYGYFYPKLEVLVISDKGKERL